MEQWIRHHAPLVDSAIIVNHASTDRTLEILKDCAPKSWKVVDTRLPSFAALEVDIEMQDLEQTLPKDDWKVILNTTEFLWAADFRTRLAEWEEFLDNPELNPEGAKHLTMQLYALMDRVPQDEPIIRHTWGYKDMGFTARGCFRFIHRDDRGYYTPGRHNAYDKPRIEAPNLGVLWAGFAPWPDCIQRKLQIQNRIPQSDKDQGFGVQHIQTEASLEKLRQRGLSISYDLLQEPGFKVAYDYYNQKVK